MENPSQTAALPIAGQLLGGKYRLERLIGQGGMGSVFAAHHELLGQRVAIKLLRNDVPDEADAITRFFNEARAAASIHSEHVARVLDVGLMEDRRPFLVMEYLEGRDLAQLLEEQGELPVEESVDYVLQAIEALAQAHAIGIVHRDLKPSNLFLAERADGVRVVKVLDFGIAKAIGGAASTQALVMTQGLMGSPAYMSPEQVRSSRSVDARSDVWALGVILYELLTGSLPFRGENVGETLAAILEKAPTPIGVFRPDLKPELVAVVMRCMARAAGDRYADLADLAEGLAPFAKRSPSVARLRSTMAALASRRADGTDNVQVIVPRAAAPDATTFRLGDRAIGQTGSSWSGADARPVRARNAAWGLALGAVIGGVAALGFVFRGPSQSTPAAASPSAIAPSAASASPVSIDSSALTASPVSSIAADAGARAPVVAAPARRKPIARPPTPRPPASAPALARDRR